MTHLLIWKFSCARWCAFQHQQQSFLIELILGVKLELIEDHRGDTYRAVYTVRFASKIYVLHVFQKKSKRGIATPQKDMELIRVRLKWAEELNSATTKDN